MFARRKKLINSLKPDFPSLPDEIAEPRPDMNIKVAAFTVSEKSINMPLPFGMGQFLKDKKSIFPC